MNRSQRKTRSSDFHRRNLLWFKACLTCSGFSIVRCLRPGFSLSSGFFRAKKRILRRKDNNEPRTTTFKPQAPGLKSQVSGPRSSPDPVQHNSGNFKAFTFFEGFSRAESERKRADFHKRCATCPSTPAPGGACRSDHRPACLLTRNLSAAQACSTLLKLFKLVFAL